MSYMQSTLRENLLACRRQVDACARYLMTHADSIISALDDNLVGESLEITLGITPYGLPTVSYGKTVIVYEDEICCGTCRYLVDSRDGKWCNNDDSRVDDGWFCPAWAVRDDG